MKYLDTLVLFRRLERLLVALGGIAALVVEALLYRWRISGEAGLVAEHDATRLLTHASPGIPFVLVPLGTSLWSPLRIGDLDPGAVGSAGQPVPIVYGRDATALRRFLGQTEVD